ncbi:MAG: hypothetical protein ACRQFF_01605 [Sphaerochaeta sp.]|jgi:hypothetical protein
MSESYGKANVLNEIKKDLTPFSIAKLILIVVSVANLIITSTYIDAILNLENAICGFIMFLFVLFGLVVLFQTSRIDEEHYSGCIVILLALVVDIYLGLRLENILNDAYINQTKLNNPEVVLSAIRTIRNILFGYGAGFVLVLFHVIKSLIDGRKSFKN